MCILKDKVAVITGAGRGIGKSIALRLSDEKMKLVLVSRNMDRLENLKNDLDNNNILIIPADLNDPSVPAVIIDKVVKEFKKLDVLINNAGIAVSKKIEDTDLEDWDKLINVNARAPFFLTKEAMKYLKVSDLKHVINIGSIVDTKGYEKQAAYTASKHALLGFSKVLAMEAQEYGIKVNIISPGGVDTELVTDMRPDINREELISPGEIAELIVFLLKSKGNAMIDQIKVRRKTKQPWA